MTLDAHEFIRFLLHVIPRASCACVTWLFGQPLQRPPRKVPSTPRPQSHCAQAPPSLSSGTDAPTHRHRYLSMPALAKGNSGLTCQPAHPATMGFFVMIAQRSKDRAVALLRARAHASVRLVSSLHLFLVLRSASRLLPVADSNTAPSPRKQRRCHVCSARCPRYDPQDNRHCFTHRFSPTGFILNASDSNCCHPIAFARIQVKTYPFNSILQQTASSVRLDMLRFNLSIHC
jgi:hypothetical protein